MPIKADRLPRCEAEPETPEAEEGCGETVAPAVEPLVFVVCTVYSRLPCGLIVLIHDGRHSCDSLLAYTRLRNT